MTFFNEEGDSSFFALSGTIAPDMVELTAGEPTEVPFLGNLVDHEDWYWVFNEDGTGWEISIGEDEWGSYSDSTELTWSATDSSLFLILYNESIDSLFFAYSVVNDSLFLEGLYYPCGDVPIEECEIYDNDGGLSYLLLLEDMEDIYFMIDLVWRRDNGGDDFPECLTDCDGFEEWIDNSPGDNGTDFCNWLLDTIIPSGCGDDCQDDLEVMEVLDTFPPICEECLAAGDCDEVISDLWDDDEGEVTVDYNEGWNLVSLPVAVWDSTYSSIYPDAVPGTLYGFDGAYVPEAALENGDGYWLFFDAEGSTDVSGNPIDQVPIFLSEGWNLMGSLSSVFESPSISDPGGIIVPGTIYGYNGAYYNADAIDPGKGYWVNASADGQVTLNSDGTARIKPFVDRTADANVIRFNGMPLYFGVTIPENELQSYELPPRPPAGASDVRFKGNIRIGGENSEIEVMSPHETIAISYDVVLDAGEYMHWVLGTGSGEEYILEQNGEITVPTEDTFTLERKAIIPIAYTLHQNYPNPFNPVTSLRYDLPEQAQVMLTVYDLMGREVTQLVNTVQEAGFRLVQWNATDSFGKPVSAGVYLYQIRAGEFVQTRKMVLLK